MRLILGLLLTLTLLAGCGDETSGDTATDATGEPSSSSSTPASPPATGPVEFTEIAVVSQSAVGGHVDEKAVDLTDEAAFAAFTAQFEDSRMEAALRTEIEGADVPEGQTLAGAVVAIGCLPPTALVVRNTDAGLMISGVPDKRSGTVECFAAVTSVAVVAVDADLV